MKIGIYKTFSSISYYGGVSVQGRMWKAGLEKLGHEVYLCNDWDLYDFNTFDWIIFMGNDSHLYDYMKLLGRFKNLRFALAPILDWEKSMLGLKVRTYLGCPRLGYHRPYYDIRRLKDKIDLFLVRSEFEKRFFTDAFGVSEDKIAKVPVHCRLHPEDVSYNPVDKEPFVYHSSRLADEGKNVARLIQAAKKYGFRMVLSGTLHGEKQREWLDKAIDGASNIEYVGRVSDDELKDLYRRAKVFALPSIIEGVGMVALEAAMHGCNIVLTDIGAPKEYFDGKAFLVNPYDVDDIGRKTMMALADNSTQPALRHHIITNYTEDICSRLLSDALQKA